MKNSKNLIGLLLGLIILVGVGIFIFIQFSNTLKETQIVLNETSITIKGDYGLVLNYDEIDQIELKETIPNVTYKTNGASFGDVKKGYFDVEGLGNCRLFIHSKEGPYLYITVDNSYIIINFKDQEKTQTLYQNLLTKLEE